MIPEHLLPHEVTRVRPERVIDAYNNSVNYYGPGAKRRCIKAWLQQDSRSEPASDGRQAQQEVWLLMCNEPDVLVVDRFEWDGHPRGAVVLEVDGPPEPTYTPSGLHHMEVSLRIVEG